MINFEIKYRGVPVPESVHPTVVGGHKFDPWIAGVDAALDRTPDVPSVPEYTYFADDDEGDDRYYWRYAEGQERGEYLGGRAGRWREASVGRSENNYQPVPDAHIPEWVRTARTERD